MKLKYIHTINGKVAGFNGNQICYANRPRINGWHPIAVNSLKEIREEQNKSKKYRKDRNYPDTDYSYVIIEVED